MGRLYKARLGGHFVGLLLPQPDKLHKPHGLDHINGNYSHGRHDGGSLAEEAFNLVHVPP